MRDLDKTEDAYQALGAPVRKPAMPLPHVKVSEGVWKAPDGRMYTNAPTPPAEPEPEHPIL